MEFLRFKKYAVERDILTVAYSIFELEKKIKKGKNIDKLKITIDSKTFNNINTDLLKEELNDLIIQVLKNDIEILIDHKDLSKDKKEKKINFKKVENICLFSGGIDSFSGILNVKKKLGDVEGVFVAHSDQARAIRTANNIIKDVLKPQSISCKKLYAPKMGKNNYSQMRGFLYFLLASIYANVKDAKNLIITECGPTMYQPRFSPYDSVTMTTHPIVLKKAKNIIEILTNKKINFLLPFENMTKAEVMINSPTKDHLKFTHSCISQAPFNHPYYHDGTCYGCVIRRIGSLCAGIDDTNYLKNPMVDNHSNMDNLISLMRFCYDILVDYDGLPIYSQGNIEIYRKKELFNRVALDTFSALHIIQKTQKLARPVYKLFKETLNSIGEKKILERTELIGSKSVEKPNFSKVI